MAAYKVCGRQGHLYAEEEDSRVKQIFKTGKFIAEGFEIGGNGVYIEFTDRLYHETCSEYEKRTGKFGGMVGEEWFAPSRYDSECGNYSLMRQNGNRGRWVIINWIKTKTADGKIRRDPYYMYYGSGYNECIDKQLLDCVWTYMVKTKKSRGKIREYLS